MNNDEFRSLGHQFIDWVADYRASLPLFPVMSPAKPGEIRAKMAKTPPLKGQGLSGILEDVDATVMPGITHWNHPGFFAYFPSNTSYASILADIVASGLGVQGMSWQTSPAATEVEEVVMDWLRQMLGLSEAFTGVIHDTASTATLCALICAREKTSNFSQTRNGMQGGASKLVVYASDQSHSSIEKAALLAGFGKANLRLIETNKDHALHVDKLVAAIKEDVAMGKRPCALVACIGTTATTAVDPLAKLADIAQKYRLWLHVDAAMAGSAMILPECRWLWEGIEAADSIVLNPHKWLGTGFDLSAYYAKDPQHLIRVMSTNPSYLRTAQDDEVKNFRDWGIPLGRRFRSLKLWFLLRDQGVEGLQARLRRDIANAGWLKDQVDKAPDWERMAPVPLQTLCLRHVPKGMKDEALLRAHNMAITDAINQSGRFYLTSAILKGKKVIRVSIGAESSERKDVEALWTQLQSVARKA
ncbi:MAG: aminotransferase class V-fold PLP-dependent enzyme [Holophagaceae bacterium]|nr:aminotransferase class V-fold PLP-dependent enzyme [Holophagaceae bacterium]